MGYQSNILKLIVQQASKFTCIFRPHVDMVLSPVAVSSVADIGHLHEQHSHAGRLPFIYTDIVSNFNESQISYLQRYRHQNKYVCKSCQISFHRKFHVLLPREIETMQKFGSARFESLVINRRYKSKSKQKKDKVVEEEDSESEEEEETDEEIDNMVFEEDYDAPMNYKQIKVNVKSLRADSILGSGLNIPRNYEVDGWKPDQSANGSKTSFMIAFMNSYNIDDGNRIKVLRAVYCLPHGGGFLALSKLDEYFYQSSLRLNSVKLLKKSKQVDEGDFLDLVVEKTDNILKVKRVRLMKILKNTTSTGRRQVIIRAWRGVFEIANPDKGKVHEEETDQSK